MPVCLRLLPVRHMLARVPVGPQSLTFNVRSSSDLAGIWITANDAGRLIEALPAGEHIAARIEQATQLNESTDIELNVAERNAVLAALEDMKAKDDLFRSLAKLEQALRPKKIE